MFGVQELEQLKVEIEEAIENAKKAESIWVNKAKEIEGFLSREQIRKLSDILEL